MNLKAEPISAGNIKKDTKKTEIRSDADEDTLTWDQTVGQYVMDGQ